MKLVEPSYLEEQTCDFFFFFADDNYEIEDKIQADNKNNYMYSENKIILQKQDMQKT